MKKFKKNKAAEPTKINRQLIRTYTRESTQYEQRSIDQQLNDCQKIAQLVLNK